jgi:acyl-CoA thioester hydrolase
VASVKYPRAARLASQLLVTARALEMGRACMTIVQQARVLPPPGEPLLCEATIRIGWVTGTPFKPANIPQTILEAFQ